MEYLTPDNLQGFVYVLLGIAAIVTAFSKGIDAWNALTGKAKREAEKSSIEARFDEQAKEIKELREQLQQHQERLDRGDEQFNTIAADSEQTLQTLSTILMHMISGNDHERMKQTYSVLVKYLAKRR